MPRIAVLIIALLCLFAFAPTAHAGWVTAGQYGRFTDDPACRDGLAWSYAAIATHPGQPEPSITLPEIVIAHYTPPGATPLPSRVLHRSTNVVPLSPTMVEGVMHDYFGHYELRFDRTLRVGSTVRLIWPPSALYHPHLEYAVTDCSIDDR